MVSKKFIPALCMLLVLINTSIKAEEDECSCGIINPSRIVGGEDTGINEFPMIAGIFYKFINSTYCGATIITQKHVLTAAHCVEDLEEQLENLAVLVGANHISQNDGTGIKKLYNIEKFKMHENYYYKTYKNDIAVVTLIENIDFSTGLRPACLPYNYVNKNFTGEKVTIVGWGRENWSGELSDTLHNVEVDVVNERTCFRHYEWLNHDVLCTHTIGKGSCGGDSGGPVLWRNPTSNRMILVGIMNFGKWCAEKYADINVPVKNYLKFIEENTPGYKYCKTY